MKKRNKFVFLATLSTACLLSLASCQGAQGPKGDQGTPGINGTNGTDGKDGQDGQNGKSVLSGKGVPASSLGTDGDSYIDTETFDFYVKSSGAWSKEGNIKGSTGDKGDAGDSGSKGEDGTSIRTGKGEPAESLGNDGDSYIDLSTFDFYVKADGKWSKEGNIKGEKGDKGDKGNNGSNGSAGQDGAPGKDGKTAWSNTILPAKNGYVTVDKGSEVVGEGKYFTFTFHGTNDTPANNKITKLTLNGNVMGVVKDSNGSETEKYYYNVVNNSGNMTLTVPVVEGGYVVYAEFGAENGTPYSIVGNDKKAYDTLQAAVDSDTCTGVKLEGTVALNDNLIIKEGKTFELDLNGKKLDCSSHTITVYGDLKLKNAGDTDATLNGSIIVKKGGSSQTARSIKNSFGGFSTFSTKGLQTYSDTTTSSYALSIEDKVKVSSETGVAIKVESGSINVIGTVSTTSGTAIQVENGSVNVLGTVSSTGGKALQVKQSASEGAKAQVTINNGAKVSTTSGTAVVVAGGKVDVFGNVSSDTGTAVNISAGSLTVTGKVESTSTTTSTPAVTVTGGEVAVSGAVSSKNSTAISVAQSSTVENKTIVTLTGTVSGTKAVTVASGTLNVKGGSVTGSTNGIEVKGGNVTVSRGTVESTSTSEDTGAAISVVQGAEGSTATTVTVKEEAKIESNSASAVSVSGSGSQTVNVNLEGGSYVTNSTSKNVIENTGSSATVTQTGINYGIKTVVEGNEGGSISVKDNLTSAAKDADVEFTFVPTTSDYEIKAVFVNGQEQTDFTGNTLTVKMTEKGITVKVIYDKYLNSVEDANNSSNKYASVSAAVTAGCTSVKLLKDSVSDEITLSKKSLTIDLNGHKLNFTEDTRINVTNGSTLEIKGTAGSEINVTTKTANKSFIKVVNDSNSEVNTVIVAENVTINDKCSTEGKTVYGLAVFNSGKEKESSSVFTKSNIQFNGTLNVDGTGLCEYGEITSDKYYESSFNKMTLGKTAKITSTFTGDTTKKPGEDSVESLAIYQAGLSEVTIEGGEYSAIDSAIEVRNGNLTIKDGTFNSTATKFSEAKNGNGKTIVGAALAVSQHGTKGDIKVIVEGGKFTGVKGLYAADVQGNGAEAIKNVSINLQKGTFTGSDADIEVRDGISCTVADAVDHKNGEGFTYNSTEQKFHISNEAGLRSFADYVNKGNTMEGKTIELDCDITLTSNWTPIGTKKIKVDGAGNNANSDGFKGKFYGNGHTISGLKVTSDEVGAKNSGDAKDDKFNVFDGYGALFCKTTGATIKDLIVSGEVSCDNAGGIVGRAKNTIIENCESNVTVKGDRKAGGIVAMQESVGRIEKCTNKGSVSINLDPYASEEKATYAGGIVAFGNDDFTITGCTNEGTIGANNAGATYTGGIIGIANSGGATSGTTITGCTNTGVVYAGNENITTAYGGQIVGYARIADKITITSCTSSGNLTGIENFIVYSKDKENTNN